jgi:hypothetical protein
LQTEYKFKKLTALLGWGEQISQKVAWNTQLGSGEDELKDCFFTKFSFEI